MWTRLGRWRDLLRQGKIRAQDVNEELIAQHLYPQDGIPVPKVDLIIRNGGDFRTSNFLPWQANGNECAAYFCAPYWPEFRKIDFLRAIRIAQTRVGQANKLNNLKHAMRDVLSRWGSGHPGGLRSIS